MLNKYGIGDDVFVIHKRRSMLHLGKCPVCNGSGRIDLPAAHGKRISEPCPVSNIMFYNCIDGELGYSTYEYFVEKKTVCSVSGVGTGMIHYRFAGDSNAETTTREVDIYPTMNAAKLATEQKNKGL